MKLLSVIKWVIWSRKNVNNTYKINYKYIKFENNDFYYFY